MRIEKLLTDNSSQFADRFTRKTKEPTGEHAFDRECALPGIEHRLIKPRHPQTHGMVERFNGRISDILATTHFRSRDNLQTTIERYAKRYNDHLPQKALGHKTPRQGMLAWRAKQPELFVRKLKNQARLDKTPIPPPIRYVKNACTVCKRVYTFTLWTAPTLSAA